MCILVVFMKVKIENDKFLKVFSVKNLNFFIVVDFLEII